MVTRLYKCIRISRQKQDDILVTRILPQIKLTGPPQKGAIETRECHGANPLNPIQPPFPIPLSLFDQTWRPYFKATIKTGHCLSKPNHVHCNGPLFKSQDCSNHVDFGAGGANPNGQPPKDWMCCQEFLWDDRDVVSFIAYLQNINRIDMNS